jgi:hypothetical protein
MKLVKALIPLVAVWAFSLTVIAEGEIGFIEKFALAPDREAALAQLVPGTEEYYFFHALHYQNSAKADKLAETMTQWARRFPNSDRRKILENREALLGYDKDPKRTLDYLREHLGLRFDHVQEIPGRVPDLPVSLDQARIAREVYLRSALNDDGLSAMEGPMLETLVRENIELRPAQRRAVLSRLSRPDLPGLVDWIAADLQTRESRGFGEFPIHNALLPDQLDALVQKVPSLAKQQAFVFARIRKLAPGADADGAHDPKERNAWLDRVWDFVKGLPPAFNSLKAHVLYARLQFDRTRGVYDKERFIEYLKLPRSAAYVNPKYFEQAGGSGRNVDLHAGFEVLGIGAGPIGVDEPLVRDYLLHFAVGEESWEPWAEWLRDTWVKAVFAEAKITGGVGDPENWASLIPPAAYQALKDRVDVEFPADNPTLTPVADEPAVDVIFKHAPKIIVRVYELNTLGYFLSHSQQPNTDLNLDGLVANDERTYDGETAPFKRVRRTFKFPELKGKRGAWVVEFIGGGRSSRALIRKGSYSLVQHEGPAGDLLTVLDEDRLPAKDAVAWLDGRRFEPDPKDGFIHIPFTANETEAAVVLASPSGSFASLARFRHHAENYQLDVQFHLDREQLLSRRDATLVVRMGLLLGSLPVAPALLQSPTLDLATTTLDGITTTTEIKVTGLSAGRDFTNTFLVPDRLAKVSATLRGTVGQLSKGGEKLPLSASKTWEVNGIDRTDAINDGQLGRFEEDYVFELLGKNGEPVSDQQVVFEFARRGFRSVETIPLRSDPKGRIQLGKLEGISTVQARIPNGRKRVWSLEEAARTWPSSITANAGEIILVPWLPLKNPGAVSLLEFAEGEFVADRTAATKQSGAFLEISGLAPGDYSLRLLDTDEHSIVIRVAHGSTVAGWIVGANRSVELRPEAGLQIESASIATNEIVVQLRHWTPQTRVHAVATRFVSGAGLFTDLGGFQRFNPAHFTPDRLPNLFSVGREIGDEYRYILERRYGPKFPGNMLPRPGLLLNPWEKRSTEAGTLESRAKESPAPAPGNMMGATSSAAREMAKRASIAAAADTSFDFLAEAAGAVFNLIPDTNGLVRIPAAALRDRQHVQILAEDPFEAVWETFALKERPTRFRDLRLERNLDPVGSFAESHDVVLLAAGGTATLPDLQTGELSTYDSLASIHALFTALNPDANLAAFSWVTRWPSLTDAEKRAKYSEFACHELNFFLSRKDPKFFAEVIKPYLANKKDKTFLDEYLLEADLTRWLAPWSYSQLNVVERALLAGRLPGESAATARRLKELLDVQPPHAEDDERLFETGLRGRGLVGDDKAKGAVDRELRELRRAGEVALGGFGGGGFGLVNAPAPAALATDALFTDGSAIVTGSRMPANGRLGIASRTNFEEPKSETKAHQMGGYSYAVPEEEMLRQRTEAAANAYYRLLGPTKEWAENNYYHLPNEGQGPDLIPLSGFWVDFASWDGKAPFLSTHVAEAHHNFSEMMLALAVLDLPFEPAKNALKVEGPAVTVTAGGPLIVFRKLFRPAPPGDAASTPGLLVSEGFYRNDDRYRQDGSERSEKFVTEEFVTGAVYGAHLVVSNPNGSAVKADVLTQLPKGAMPVSGSRMTQSRHVRIEPYATEQFDYQFYFPSPSPAAAAFPHLPSSATAAGKAAGAAKSLAFRVVAKPSKADTESWEYVSQQGSEADVFAFLDRHNLEQLDLARVAWRTRANFDFYRGVIALLAKRHVWNDTLYGYAVHHNDPAALRELLRHRDDFLNLCGDWLDCRLVRIDPVERRRYEHLEYAPLVNQRAHRVGAENRIANPVVRDQFTRLLGILSYKPSLDPADELAVTYFLFLQDRVEEALARFHGVKPESVATRIQYDYLACYADFYEEKPEDARSVASKYANHPVDRWKALFAEVIAQLDEAEGRTPTRPGGPPDREKQQAELAAAEPSLDFKVENRTLSLSWSNLREVTINYYLMDPEFLFSSSPFVAHDSDRFGIVRPTLTARQALPAGKESMDVPLPDQFAKANVLVEVLGAGLRQAQAYHANTFKLTLAENQGRLELRDPAAGKPITKAYVKVYAQLNDGGIRFLKDGYTDLRGRFDYASVNSGATAVGGRPQADSGIDHPTLRPDEAARIQKLAILVLSDTHGAAVREVDAPSL